MTSTFTNEQAQELLAMAGVTPEPKHECNGWGQHPYDCQDVDEPEPVSDTGRAIDNATALADILAKSKGVRETGEKLVDTHIETLWAKRKVTKLQAAAMGLVASEHNRSAWSELQTLRGELKSAVRKHSREGAHVATKITASKGKTGRSPELDAFLLKHAADPNVQALAALLSL